MVDYIDIKITPEKVRELLAGITHDYAESDVMHYGNAKMAASAPDIAQAYLKKCEEVDTCYKPCFITIIDYVQKNGSDWDVKYLGRSCHDVIIDRCETLEHENQRLQVIIDKMIRLLD